jgi:uncharacterized membrane protein
MLDKKTTSEQLAAFSDGVFAVILTFMVLKVHCPVSKSGIYCSNSSSCKQFQEFSAARQLAFRTC